MSPRFSALMAVNHRASSRSLKQAIRIGRCGNEEEYQHAKSG